MTTDTLILYIVSPAYSGSTLLAALLATHPAIGTIGERGHFHRKMVARPVIGSPFCSCGRRFDECDFWLAVSQQVQAAVSPAGYRRPFSTFRLYPSLPRRLNRYVEKLCLRHALQHTSQQLPWPVRGRYRQAAQANAALIQAVLQVSGKSVFLDASKSEMDAVLLNDLPGFRVMVLHLIRDGRAQVYSTLRHHQDRDAAQASRQWAGRIRAQQRLLGLAGLPLLRLGYEALCADPAGTMASIFTFAGLPADQGSLAFRQPHLHIMGNPMRLSHDSEIIDRQAWRTSLTAEQLATFTQIAGDLNSSLGYR